jgi:hypothetical protein
VCAVILFSGPTQEWLASRRGEAAPVAASTSDVPAGAPVELATDQIKALQALAPAMNTVAFALLVLGIFKVVAAFVYFTPASLALGCAEGVAMLLLSWGIGTAACSVNGLLEPAGRNMGYVAKMFAALSLNFTVQIAVFLAVAVATAFRVALGLM